MTLGLTMQKSWTREFILSPLNDISAISNQGYVRGVKDGKVTFGYPTPLSPVETDVSFGAVTQTNDIVYVNTTGLRYVFVHETATNYILTEWNATVSKRATPKWRFGT